LTLRADEDICDEGMPHQLSPQIPIRLTPLANRDRISPRLPLSGLCDTVLKEAERQRKAEAEEKRLRALEERKRKDEEFLNRLLQGRSSRESMREDEDD